MSNTLAEFQQHVLRIKLLCSAQQDRAQAAASGNAGALQEAEQGHFDREGDAPDDASDVVLHAGSDSDQVRFVCTHLLMQRAKVSRTCAVFSRKTLSPLTRRNFQALFVATALLLSSTNEEVATAACYHTGGGPTVAWRAGGGRAAVCALPHPGLLPAGALCSGVRLAAD